MNSCFLTLSFAAFVVLSVSSLASHPQEGPLEDFLGTPSLSQTRLFASQRFPNVVVTKGGAVLALWGQTTVQVRRSTDGGTTWAPATDLRAGIHGGGATVDEASGDILAFVEEKGPPAPLHILRSQDDGITWSPQNFTILPNSQSHVPSMHMNERGITLRHGSHAGRLIRATRWYGASSYPASVWPTHYTNAMFSDDGGQTWQASEAFPIMGAGEACIVELSDGTLHYNTRRHWAENSVDALWRWSATSSDGGLTWTDAWKSTVLPDGNTNSTYGLMGGMVRLPVADRDILLFSNIVNNAIRANGFVWASFDGGQTWPLRRSVYSGSFAYSALAAGRPGTPSQGWIYLFYEGGPEGGGTMARFNLAWLLDAAEPTGNGTVPEWIDHNAVTPTPAENPGAALWAFEENPVGETAPTASAAIRDVHPAGNDLHLTANAPFPVVAGAATFGNGRAISIAANGGATILDEASANRFDYGPGDSFTIEIVCRIPAGSTQIGALVAKDLGSTSPSWWLRVENGKARFLVSDIATECGLFSTADINTGEWVHIAAVRDAADATDKQLRLYIDGQAAGSLADTTSGSFANAQALWIGRFNSGSRLLTGDIDLVRITPAALDPGQFATRTTQFDADADGIPDDFERDETGSLDALGPDHLAGYVFGAVPAAAAPPAASVAIEGGEIVIRQTQRELPFWQAIRVLHSDDLVGWNPVESTATTIEATDHGLLLRTDRLPVDPEATRAFFRHEVLSTP